MLQGDSLMGSLSDWIGLLDRINTVVFHVTSAPSGGASATSLRPLRVSSSDVSIASLRGKSLDQVSEQELKALVNRLLESDEEYPAGVFLPREAAHRSPWQNVAKNITGEPLLHARPRDVNELKTLLESALKDGLRVKAVGSGHSFSDVAATTDLLIDTSALNTVCWHNPLL